MSIADTLTWTSTFDDDRGSNCPTEGSPSIVAQILILRNNPELLRYDDAPTPAQIEWQQEMECYNIHPVRCYPRASSCPRGIRVPTQMRERSVQAGPEQVAPQLLRSDEEIDRLAEGSVFAEYEYGMEIGWLALLRYYVDLSKGAIRPEDQHVVFSYTPTSQGQDHADRQLETLLLEESEHHLGPDDRRQTIGLSACGPTFRLLICTHSKGTIYPPVRPWGEENHPFDLRESDSLERLWMALGQLPRVSIGRRFPKELAVRSFPYEVTYCGERKGEPDPVQQDAKDTSMPSGPPSPRLDAKMIRSGSEESTSSSDIVTTTTTTISTSMWSATFHTSPPQLDITFVSARATFVPFNTFTTDGAKTEAGAGTAISELTRAVKSAGGQIVSELGKSLARKRAGCE